MGYIPFIQLSDSDEDFTKIESVGDLSEYDEYVPYKAPITEVCKVELVVRFHDQGIYEYINSNGEYFEHMLNEPEMLKLNIKSIDEVVKLFK
jgi:hypothetical protein